MPISEGTVESSLLAMLLILGPAIEAQTPSTPKIVFETGHKVRQIAFGAGGYLVTAGAYDNTIKLWDFKTRRPVRTIRQAASPYKFGTLTEEKTSTPDIKLWPNRDGRLLASGDGKKIRLWTLNGRLQSALSAMAEVGDVAFSPDGQWLAAATGNAGLEAWRLDGSKTHIVLLTPRPPPRMINSEGEAAVGFTAEGELAYASPLPFSGASPSSSDFDATVFLYELPSTKSVRQFPVQIPKDGVKRFNPQGDRLVGIGDKRIVMYGVPKGELLWSLPFDSSPGDQMDLRFSGDGRFLAAGLRKRLEDTASIDVCDVASGRSVRTLRTSKGMLFLDGGFAFSPDERQLVISEDDNVAFYDLDSGSQAGVLPVDEDVTAAQFSANGRWFSVWGADNTLNILDTAGAGQVTSLAVEDNFVLSPDGRRLAAEYSPEGSGEQAVRKVKVWDVLTGRLLHDFDFARAKFGEDGIDGMPFSPEDGIGGMAFSPDGRLLAIQDAYAKVRVFDAETGKVLHEFDGFPSAINSFRAGKDLRFDFEGKRLGQTNTAAQNVLLWGMDNRRMRIPTPRALCLAFSPDGTQLAVGTVSGTIAIWKIDTPALVRTINTEDGVFGVSAVAFSKDGQLLASGGAGGSVKLWNASSGALLRKFDGHISLVTDLVFDPGGRWLASMTSMSKFEGSGEATRIWNLDSGELLGSVACLGAGNWIVVAPNGLFDGSPESWNRILWRFSDNTFDVAPVEIFFREFYYPGLLGEILAGKLPKAGTDIANIDRRQPVVAIERVDSTGAGQALGSRTIKLRLQVSDAPPNAQHKDRGGARDVRLFRNATLVKVWHGDLQLDSQGNVQLETELPIVAGENKFTAYAYSKSDIKSLDSTLIVTGADSLKRRGVGYILAIGVNDYANKDYNLKYAVPDVQEFASVFSEQQRKLQNYSALKVTYLLDNDATKANILAALGRLAGGSADQLTLAQQKLFADLASAQPEDGVFIYYAGHGHAVGPRFYLLPHDMIMPDRIEDLAKPEAQAVSDLELGDAFEKIGAGRSLFVIDACRSGQALEAEEKRRGPMNSKGLAQLAWEKGMYILTASQGYQSALESPELGGGHGFLTYALVEKGLKTPDAAVNGQVELRHWLDFATQLVPQLQLALMQEAQKQGRGFGILDGEDKEFASPEQRSLQRPRVFYRREEEAQPFIVARQE